MGCVKSKEEVKDKNIRKPPVPLVESKEPPCEAAPDKLMTFVQSKAPVAPANESDPESIADSPKQVNENVSPSKHSDSFE